MTTGLRGDAMLIDDDADDDDDDDNAQSTSRQIGILYPAYLPISIYLQYPYVSIATVSNPLKSAGRKAYRDKAGSERVNSPSQRAGYTRPLARQ